MSIVQETPYFVTHEEARAICMKHPISSSIEMVKLDDAHSRILAQDLISKVNDPPFDNSSMDGFASQWDESATYPQTLRIIGIQTASGSNAGLPVGAGEAVRIMTGAPMPPGANAILPIEQCSVDEGEGTVVFHGAPKPHFVRKCGENLREKSVGLTKGAYLTPSRVGLCATMGYATVPVYRRLRIGIVSTGDELKPPGEDLAFGEIYESNSYGIAGLVSWVGHEPIRFTAVADTLEELRAALDKAAETCDMILTSGGVSMGEYDMVRKLMEDEGEIHFWRVKIRPGSPPIFGTWRGKPIFGLPGNPVSSHVVFRMIVAPYIRDSLQADGPKEWIVRAKLCDPVKSTEDCLTLRRVTLASTDEGMMAYQPKHQGSGNLDSLASADGLTLLEAGQHGEVGQWIDVIVL